MKNLIVVSSLVLLIDYIYLSLFGATPFLRMVENIQNKKVVVNKVSAAIAYILIIIAVYKYVINKLNYIDTFILGSVIYGIFDFTNLALFKNYKVSVAIQDTIWGGVLFTTTHYLFNKITRM